MRLTHSRLRQLIREMISEAPRSIDLFMGKTEDEWLDEFIDYWKKERLSDPDLDSHDQPDYDDVDAWSPSTWVTSVVWSGLQQMRSI